MRTYRYGDATVHIEGDLNIDKVKEATETFLRKAMKELGENVERKTRTIEEQQVLDK